MTRRSGAHALLFVVLFVGLLLRMAWIDRIPGINGDEAWYGVNVNELLGGRSAFFQTPSGNVVNPVHSFPLLLISSVAPPSFTLLRVPEVWWGALAILLCYPLLAKPLGARAALLATVLLTLSPTALTYARLGWDPSGTPFIALLAIAAALHDRPLLMFAGLAVAYVVHPTNIFLFPFAALAWAPHARCRYAASTGINKRRFGISATVLALIALPAGAMLTVAVARMGRLPSIEMVTDRLVNPVVWSDVALSMVRLFSGVTATTYIAGAMPRMATILADAIAAIVLGLAVVALLRRARDDYWRGALVVGLGFSMLMFHVVAGRIAIEPGHERYAMALVVPFAVVAAAGLDALMRAMPRLGVTATVSLCVAYVSVISGGYFYPLLTRGGDAHPTFRTGDEEPKAAALAYIRSVVAQDDLVAVFAEEWWLYWPTRYLALPDRERIIVEMLGNAPPVYPSGADRAAYARQPDKVFAVVFDGSPAWLLVKELGRPVFTARDPIARPILHVVEIAPDLTLPFADPPPWATSADR